jgi:hypothetical protein
VALIVRHGENWQLLLMSPLVFPVANTPLAEDAGSGVPHDTPLGLLP